ncbi:MAG: alpha/beta fold hydrolase [Chthoniobacterales bacterium]
MRAITRLCLPIGIFATTLAAAPAQFAPATPPSELGTLATRERVTFGYVSVPENRRDPENDRRIRLAVIIVKARASTPEPDPVFYFVGGPGGSATLSSADLPLFEALNEERDLVFADPRGAGFSIPRLNAPRNARTVADFASRNFTFLRSIGVDPSAYNTSEIAADYEDVRLALGYDKINVVASSYGTIVAQEFLRHHSDNVRALVMSGNSPAPDPFLPTALEAERIGLLALFRDVATNRRARRNYPNLKDRYFRLVARLDRQPLRFSGTDRQTGRRSTVTITGSKLLQTTTALLQTTDTIRLIPLLVQQLERGQINQLPARFFAPDSRRRRVDANDAFGMYLSVLATDFAAPNYTAQTAASVRAEPRPALRKASGAGLSQLAAIVEAWDVPYAPGTTRTLPSSDVKTLLLNGRMDAQTPSSGGAVIAANLSASINYVYPRVGHAVGLIDGPDLDAAVTFIKTPTRRPRYDVARLLRRDFYATRQPARGTPAVEDWRERLVDPPVRPPDLGTAIHP